MSIHKHIQSNSDACAICVNIKKCPQAVPTSRESMSHPPRASQVQYYTKQKNNCMFVISGVSLLRPLRGLYRPLQEYAAPEGSLAEKESLLKEKKRIISWRRRRPWMAKLLLGTVHYPLISNMKMLAVRVDVCQRTQQQTGTPIALNKNELRGSQ